MKRIFTIGSIILLHSTNAYAEFNFSQPPTQLSTYYSAPFQTVQKVKKRLIENGFTIVAINKINEDEIVTISNSELKATNSYLATLHLLINHKRQEIRIQNPSYFGAAYLEEQYHYGQFKETLNALLLVLGTMSETEERVEFKKLASYKFMFGMPKLKDTISIAQGEKLLENLGDKHIAYSLKLPNGSTLVGHHLSSENISFLSKINQRQNRQILPYEAIIKNREVTILNPKYYLALSLPLLSMQEFMKIATTPEHIERNIREAYKIK